MFFLSILTYTNRPVTFLVAGGDPTAHTLSFTVYEVVSPAFLSFGASSFCIQLRHPHVLGKLRAELDAAIPCVADMPDIDAARLPYLNAVVKESLRYNGPGFGTFRYCERDTEVGGVTFPAHTTLALWNPQGTYTSKG